MSKAVMASDPRYSLTTMKIKQPFLLTLKRNWLLLIMLLPAIAYTVLFSYVPMAGIVVAFKDYSVRRGIFGSKWCGFDNFLYLKLSGKLWTLTRNTLLYNFAFIVTGIILQIGFAVILNELIGRKVKKFCQTVMFLPHFVSWVVVAAIMYNFFNYEKGVVNNVFSALGIPLFDLYNKPNAWPLTLVIINAWKGTGYGSVVYLAAITGLDQEMFEAANIDGANIWQKIRYITIPCLAPTTMIMFLLALGRVFRGDFGMFYQTVGSNARLLTTADILDTYIYRAMLSSGNFPQSSAGGLYQSVLCFVTILAANFTVKKIQPDYTLF